MSVCPSVYVIIAPKRIDWIKICSVFRFSVYFGNYKPAASVNVDYIYYLYVTYVLCVRFRVNMNGNYPYPVGPGAPPPPPPSQRIVVPPYPPQYALPPPIIEGHYNVPRESHY